MSGVDETIDAPDTATAVVELATRKGMAVVERAPQSLVLACDSLLDLEGLALGKPASATDAVDLWRRLGGKVAVLWTGHWLRDTRTGNTVTEAVSTTVRFAVPTVEEIDAYVATGEPLRLAGGFSIEGYGAPFVEGIDGDPSNVLGVSLPVLRRMLGVLDVAITDLWT